MNRETVNEAMEVEVPNGFYVLSAEELRLAYQSEDPNRWGNAGQRAAYHSDRHVERIPRTARAFPSRPEIGLQKE